MDCSLPDSSVHRICQARILEWVAISYSKGSSRPRDRTHVSCIAGGFFTTEPPGKPNLCCRVSHYLDFAHQIPVDSETCFSVKVVVRMGTSVRFWFLFFLIFVYLAAPGLTCYMGDSRCGPQALFVTHKLSCPAACGIFVPSQGWNFHPLPCKLDS